MAFSLDGAAEAANHYLILEAEDVANGRPLGAAASFAREFEEAASAEEFDAYLRFVDLARGEGA